MRTALCSFEKFVPNRVIKEILNQDLEAHLGVAPFFATVFFCDIEVCSCLNEQIIYNPQDFTSIAEIMDPINLVELLLDFLQEMSNIILEETHGTIDKFIGDAIMVIYYYRAGIETTYSHLSHQAFWNAPHPVENHPEMACQAALRCRDKIATDLNPKWMQKGLPQVSKSNSAYERFVISCRDYALRLDLVSTRGIC